jgi:hypothetical protein
MRWGLPAVVFLIFVSHVRAQGFAMTDFALYDTNHDGYMTFDEYYNTYVKFYGPIDGNTLMVEFKSMDFDQDGLITKLESEADDSAYYQDNDDLFVIMDY